MIIALEGSSYRPPGAATAFVSTGAQMVMLTSGRIEADVALHARDYLASGEVKRLKYGRGLPDMDIVLPCGRGV